MTLQVIFKSRGHVWFTLVSSAAVILFGIVGLFLGSRVGEPDRSLIVMSAVLVVMCTIALVMSVVALRRLRR